jgi:tryptophan-rich sensory protein
MFLFLKEGEEIMSMATSEVQPTKRVSVAQPRWRWYHAAAFYGVVQLLTFGLSGLVSLARGNKSQSLREATFGDVSYFERLKQVKITPPSWAFGPAWLLNNIAVIWGTWQVLNKPKQTPGRTTYLALQGASWVDFVLFNAAYFSLRSPLNALVLTLVMFLLTIASGIVALFQLKDSKVALSLATLFVWLLVALTAATFQALWNKDDFYQVGPFVKPTPGLVKKEA